MPKAKRKESGAEGVGYDQTSAASLSMKKTMHFLLCVTA